MFFFLFKYLSNILKHNALYKIICKEKSFWWKMNEPVNFNYIRIQLELQLS